MGYVVALHRMHWRAGNGIAARVPAAVMKAAKISLEQAVDVCAEDGREVL